MKKLLILLFFTPLFSFGQKSHGYFNISAEMLNYSNVDPCFGASFSLGYKGKNMSIGGGVLFTQLSGTKSPYVPAFAEIMLYPSKHVVRPYMNFQVGYGFYSEQVYGLGTQKGSLYLRPGLGVLLPVKKRDLFLRISYVHSEFSFKSVAGQKMDGGSSNGWTASFGISL